MKTGATRKMGWAERTAGSVVALWRVVDGIVASHRKVQERLHALEVDHAKLQAELTPLRPKSRGRIA